MTIPQARAGDCRVRVRHRTFVRHLVESALVGLIASTAAAVGTAYNTPAIQTLQRESRREVATVREAPVYRLTQYSTHYGDLWLAIWSQQVSQGSENPDRLTWSAENFGAPAWAESLNPTIAIARDRTLVLSLAATAGFPVRCLRGEVRIEYPPWNPAIDVTRPVIENCRGMIRLGPIPTSGSSQSIRAARYLPLRPRPIGLACNVAFYATGISSAVCRA